MSTFTAVIIPFIVLMALFIANPQVATRHLGHTSYADFLIPAMATFALLNACYVNTITSVVLAREEGVLKRLHGTPLPLWAYVIGRIAAGAVVGAAAVLVVLVIGATVMDVRIWGIRLADLIAVTALGIVTFTVSGLAVSTLVPRPETALPVAYGTVLPLAFVSDVFFPGDAEPTWLRHVSAAFPVAPVADPLERLFGPGPGWPMTAEPGPGRRGLDRRSRARHRSPVPLGARQSPSSRAAPGGTAAARPATAPRARRPGAGRSPAEDIRPCPARPGPGPASCAWPSTRSSRRGWSSASAACSHSTG